MIIFFKEKCVLLFPLVWSNLVLWVHFYCDIISYFAYHFSGENYLSINIQGFLKFIYSWCGFYNAVTMTWYIFRINNTIITFRYDQLHVGNISIKYCSIDVFIICIIFYLINKIQNSKVVVRYQNLRELVIDNYGIYLLIKLILNFRIPGNS